MRYVVAARSPTAGTEIRELPLGGDAWIGLVIRDGEARDASGATVL